MGKLYKITRPGLQTRYFIEYHEAISHAERLIDLGQRKGLGLFYYSGGKWVRFRLHVKSELVRAEGAGRITGKNAGGHE